MLKELNNYLTSEKVAEVKENPIKELSNIANNLGYKAIAKEITMNRRARDNFEYMIKLLDRNKTSLTAEDKRVFKTLKELAEYLPKNNNNQLQYLKLKQDYENATFKLAQEYEKIEHLEKRSEEWREGKDKIKHYEMQFDIAKDRLDRFILNLI